MRLLILGDVVGRPGRIACERILPRLIADREIDCVIVNAENAAGGSGLTPDIFHALRAVGVDGVTLGDHIYKRREIIPLLRDCDRMIRPANLPPEAEGRELMIVPARDGSPVAVVSVLGRIFMNVHPDCPFHAVERVLATLPPEVRIVVVDVHAEATAEKVAMGWYLDGRATVVFGTHTHVPTADERILPGGTAYITDLGMSGPYDSVLGRERDRVIPALVTGMPHPFDVATGNVNVSGIVVEADATTGRAASIERIFIKDARQPG